MDPEKHLQQQQQQQQQTAQATVVPQQPQQPQQPQPPRPQQPQQPQQARPQQPQQPQQQPQLGLPPQHLQQAQGQDESSLLQDPMSTEFMNHFPTLPDGTADTSAEEGSVVKRKAGRRKIPIEFIDDKSRRQITFSKRKAGLMKKAYELTTLTGTQALLLVASETGHVYTFATPKLQPFVTIPEGKSLIQACLNAPDPQPIGPNATGQPQAPRPQGPYETKNEEAYEQPGAPAGYQQEQAPAHWGAPSLS